MCNSCIPVSSGRRSDATKRDGVADAGDAGGMGVPSVGCCGGAAAGRSGCGRGSRREHRPLGAAQGVFARVDRRERPSGAAGVPARPDASGRGGCPRARAREKRRASLRRGIRHAGRRRRPGRRVRTCDDPAGRRTAAVGIVPAGDDSRPARFAVDAPKRRGDGHAACLRGVRVRRDDARLHRPGTIARPAPLPARGDGGLRGRAFAGSRAAAVRRSRRAAFREALPDRALAGRSRDDGDAPPARIRGRLARHGVRAGFRAVPAASVPAAVAARGRRVRARRDGENRSFGCERVPHPGERRLSSGVGAQGRRAALRTRIRRGARSRELPAEAVVRLPRRIPARDGSRFAPDLPPFRAQ